MIIGSRLCINGGVFRLRSGFPVPLFFREATLDNVLIVRRGPDQIEKPNDCSCEMLRRCIPSESVMSDKKQKKKSSKKKSKDFRALFSYSGRSSFPTRERGGLRYPVSRTRTNVGCRRFPRFERSIGLLRGVMLR